MRGLTRASACLLSLLGACQAAPGAVVAEELHQETSRITDKVLPPQVDDMPQRPRPILELGDPFLGTGPLRPGIELPTGEVIQPSLQVFGVGRTAVQTFDDGDTTTTEWANRLDLFANLQLSGTERILYGVRPLDENGDFSGFNFEPSADDGWQNEFNADTTSLFFEGDFGEILPTLDSDDSASTDWGVSVGRQPLLSQDGLLINDTIDSVGVTRNTILARGTSNLRVTGLYGWNEINRDDNREDGSTQLFGLLSEADLRASTVSLDALWVYDSSEETDALYLGAGAVQRFGQTNSTVRVVSSHALRSDTPEASTGTLLFTELSRTPHGSDDVVYANAFWGIDEFSSAARGPATGGPWGRVGILFAAVGLGRYGAPLGSRADKSIGGAFGYQKFLFGTRQQLILELGGRTDTDGSDEGAIALGGRYQQAIGQRWVMRIDGFVAEREGEDFSAGARLEFLVKL